MDISDVRGSFQGGVKGSFHQSEGSYVQPQMAEADRPAAEMWSVVYRMSPDGGLWSVQVVADTPIDAAVAVRWWAQHHHDASMLVVVGVIRLESVR